MNYWQLIRFENLMMSISISNEAENEAMLQIINLNNVIIDYLS